MLLCTVLLQQLNLILTYVKIFNNVWMNKYKPHSRGMLKLKNNSKERRHATLHEPMLGQFENAEPDNQGVDQHIQHDYSFNLTGIVPPHPPKWKQVNHLYEDFKKFKRSCICVFEGPMAHVSKLR